MARGIYGLINTKARLVAIMTEESQHMGGPLSSGTLLANRYRLERRLATGGTGSVYLASDLQRSEAKVAVKVLHASYLQNKTLVARFTREAKLLNSIEHINIVKMLDVHVESNQVFLVTEHIVGQTLFEWFNEGEKPYDSLLKVIEQICSGLTVVHELGILHRDLKPENILMQESGLIKIIDFGAARTPKSQLTLAGQLVGTTPYIAPEVWIEKKLTPAVDFYSLGVILYQLTTNELPFESQRTSDLMRMHIESAPKAPQELVEDIPYWLNQLILKLLSKNPASRHQRASQIIRFLQRAQENQAGPQARTDFKQLSQAAVEPGRKEPRRRRVRKKKGLLAKIGLSSGKKK